MKTPSIESQISTRFLQVLSDHVGPARKYRFKKAFADCIGMRQQELTKIEHGASVQYRHLIALQKLTGANFTWLLTGAGEKYTHKNNGAMSLEQRVAALEKVSKVSGKK